MPGMSRESRIERPSSAGACSPSPTRSSWRRIKPISSFVIGSDDQENRPTRPARPTRFCTKRKRNCMETATKDNELPVDDLPPAKRTAREPKKFDSSCPSTPRHGENRAKIALTPIHRIGLLNRPCTPRSNPSPSTHRLLFASVYNEGRKLFRGSVQSTKIIGREKEKAELQGFISKRFKAKSSGCMYVSGPPGTGKSALVKEVLEEVEAKFTVGSTHCNCMSVRTASDVYSKLLNDFGVEMIMQGTEMENLDKLFRRRKRAYCVVLDEIDHLVEVDMELVYQLFDWSLDKSTSLMLVGIANALDLTDRFLPRLKAKNMRPHLVPFMPYSVAEVSMIISTKLRTLVRPMVGGQQGIAEDYLPFIHPTAIEYLAKKVTVQTGDLRKAFAICVRAIDMIEAETRESLSRGSQNADLTPESSPSKTPLGENRFLASPSRSGLVMQKGIVKTTNLMSHLTVETAPRAKIAHVARVTAAAFSNGQSQRLAVLNLQQKAALCTLSALEKIRQNPTADLFPCVPQTPTKSSHASKENAAARPDLRVIYEAYTKLCTQDNILQPLSATEFKDILMSLEAVSLVTFFYANKSLAGTPSKRGRGDHLVDGQPMDSIRVATGVSQAELRLSLTGPGTTILLALLES